MIVVRVAGDLRVDTADLLPGDFSALQQRAKATERYREKRFGQLQVVEREIKLSRFEGGALVLPRGMTRDVREVLGARARLVDETVRSSHAFSASCAFRSHQHAMAAAVAEHVQGLVIACTGAGKTAGAFASIVTIGQKTLVLVPTIDLARQWARETQRFLGIDAAVCTGGDWTDAPVVIATPGTALRHVERLRTFGALFVDEVQGFGTELRMSLLAQIPAHYRIGQTATLPTDHRGAILAATFGAVRFRFSVDQGIAGGALIAPTFAQVPTAFRAHYESADDWQALLDNLVSDTGRNALIVETVMREGTGICTLVLSARLAHLAILRDLFTARGVRAEILSGAVSKAQRIAVLEAAKAGELDVLLGSTVADEGIDVPGLGAVALAFPSKSEARMLQRIGRCVRSAPGKPRPIVIDFVDDVGPLRRQAAIRAETFARTFNTLPGVAA